METSSSKPRPQQLKPLVRDCDAAVPNRLGEVIGVLHSDEKPELHHQLDSEAHQRWKGNIAVEFLKTVSRIDVQNTRCSNAGVLLYELVVHLRPTHKPASTQTGPANSLYLLERSFTDFEDLRRKVLDAVSLLPQCTCQYCFDFVLYIRYKFKQPRSIVKLITGVNKRKQILSVFINDFVDMAKCRVSKPGKRKCQAQELVPIILEAFLLP